MNGKQLAELILNTPLIEDETLLSVSTKAIIDYFACCLQAKNETEIQQLKQWIIQEGGKPTAYLIGQKTLATPRQAALFNGFQAHYLDYDDVHEQVRGHPSAVILSALLASIDINNNVEIDNQRFLSAYIIGVEIMARIGEVLNPQHYQQGFHSTATLGGIAAVTAICYLHNYRFLDQAFALVSTQAGGLRLVFGTSIKPMNAGFAAQSAIQTIEILNTGLTCQADFLDKKVGFLSVYGKNPELDMSDWGKSWRILTPGLWQKNYSYCSAAATVADAAELIAEHISLDEIAEIELEFNPQGDTALIYTRPQTPKEGRFSAEYIVAKILAKESITLESFSEAAISPHIQQIMQKIHRTYGKEQYRYGEVKVRLKNGEFFSQRIIYPKGSPQTPYDEQAIYSKLENALQSTLSQSFFKAAQALKYEGNFVHFLQTYQYLL